MHCSEKKEHGGWYHDKIREVEKDEGTAVVLYFTLPLMKLVKYNFATWAVNENKRCPETNTSKQGFFSSVSFFNFF